jgi:tRNA A-37 threonylcarbamoyl transferase component Bud32
MWSVRVLKRDSFGRVEELSRSTPEGLQRLIRRVACGGSLPLSRRVARLLAQRERRALEALCGLEGVPSLARSLEAELAVAGECVVLRSFCEGTPLHRCELLPIDFFERLEELVRELHARGVAHNDLHKEQNIVVGPDGRPSLIDFQLASVHGLGSRALAVRMRDDLRHIAKHRRRYLRFTRVVDVAPPREWLDNPPRAPRRRGAALVWRKTAKPLYNFLTRSILRRRDGEERRVLAGPWPCWSPACGPRSQRMSSR